VCSVAHPLRPEFEALDHGFALAAAFVRRASRKLPAAMGPLRAGAAGPCVAACTAPDRSNNQRRLQAGPIHLRSA
jgi:hypothetical protein